MERQEKEEMDFERLMEDDNNGALEDDILLMSQEASCETSTTRDVGLSAAMIAVGALATYGIMRRTQKTSDDFQRV